MDPGKIKSAARKALMAADPHYYAWTPEQQEHFRATMDEAAQGRVEAVLLNDILNMALFGITAKEWRDANPDSKGNMRDHANVHQLVCLTNPESMNAHYIDEGLSQQERLIRLNELAIRQMKVLVETNVTGRLSKKK